MAQNQFSIGEIQWESRFHLLGITGLKGKLDGKKITIFYGEASRQLIVSLDGKKEKSFVVDSKHPMDEAMEILARML